MTQNNGGVWVLLPQLVYALPTLLVAIAGVIVCIVNWQKAPTAAMFCLIGSCLIGFNAISSAFATYLMVQFNASVGPMKAWWAFIAIVRVLLNVSGFVFLLIAVFSGRPLVTKQNLFETTPSSQGR
jgi:hypothetical protein